MTPWSLAVRKEKSGLLCSESGLITLRDKKDFCCFKHKMYLKDERVTAKFSVVNALVGLRIPPSTL